VHELPLLRMRALLARAQGDEDAYRDFANRYRKMATDLSFDGHIAMAEAMTSSTSDVRTVPLRVGGWCVHGGAAADEGVKTTEILVRYIRKDISLVTSASSGDTATVSALRLGDATAFADLVTGLHAGLVRFARIYLPDSIAEDVVQDTWESVIDSIDRFEGRSSLKSWIYRILLNTARTRARREAEEVCEALGISSVNQRVLLHRGRASVRRAIEEYFDA